MKKILTLTYLIVVVALASQEAMATGLTIRGGVTNNNYELFNPDGSSWVATPQHNNNVGLKFPIGESSYFDVNIAKGEGVYNGLTYTGKVTSSDLAVSFGNSTVHTNGNLGSIYLGLKMSKTKLMPDNTAAAIAANAGVYNFKSTGLVLGGGEAFPLDVGGYLTLSLALGAMKGQYDASTINSNSVMNFKADNAAYYSYGVGYFHAITSSVSFTVDYKGQFYDYTYNSDLPNKYKLREKFSGFGATLYVRF